MAKLPCTLPLAVAYSHALLLAPPPPPPLENPGSTLTMANNECQSYLVCICMGMFSRISYGAQTKPYPRLGLFFATTELQTANLHTFLITNTAEQWLFPPNCIAPI